MEIQVSSRVTRTLVLAAALVMATITMVASAVAAPTDFRDPRLVPPNTVIGNYTFGEWGDAWWNWAVREPSATNPNVDPTGEFNARNQTADPVWFLAGVFGGRYANRTVVVPSNRYIFFPLITTLAAGGGTEAELRFRVNRLMNNVTRLELIIDGVRVRNLFKYRAQSPRGGFVLRVRPNSLFTELGAPPGNYAPAVQAGYWIMLKPLPVGEHKIIFEAYQGDSNLVQRVIYRVLVRKRVF